jgi:hypothetical protein
VFEVKITLPAAEVLGRHAGLRARVEEMLIAILDTAHEMRGLQDGYAWFDPHPAQSMRLRVGQHVVSYTLDPDARVATVLAVERCVDRRSATQTVA